MILQKRLLSLSILFLLLCRQSYTSEPYRIAALNPVKFETPAPGAEIVLLENGELTFALVADLAAENAARVPGSDLPLTSHRKSLHLASELLQKSFARCTGKTPRVLAPDSPELADFPFHILVGKSPLTDRLGIAIESMPVEGFKIMTFDKGIALAGRDGSMIPGSYQKLDMGMYAINGTLQAAYDFVERFLGMRFYFPGHGVHVPHIENLKITPVCYTDHPRFLTRNFGSLGNRFLNPDQAKDSGKRPAARNTQSYWPWPDIENDQREFVHAYRQARSSRFMASEGPHPFMLGKAFPDKLDTIFYRDPSGRLRYSDSVYTDNYFDVSNPDFAKLLADSYQKFYQTEGEWCPLWNNSFHPNPEYMWFGPVDTGCVIENERTKSLLIPDAPMYRKLSEINSRFYLMLAEKIAKSLPDKKIAFMAYSYYLGAPQLIDQFPENVRIMACVGTPAYIKHPGYQKFFREIYQDWNAKLADKVIPYLYDPSYYEQGGISHAVRGMYEGEFLRSMAPAISDSALFACVHFRWEYYYSAYLVARAYWNPDFDCKAALHEHWQLMYQEAAPFLEEFYQLVLERWEKHYLPSLKVDKRCIPGIDYKVLYSNGFPREVADTLRGLLAKARQAVPVDSPAGKRLIFISMPWEKLLDEIVSFQQIQVQQYSISWIDKEQTISIDGKLEEEHWRKSSVFSPKSALYGVKKPAAPLVKIRMLWNQKGIFVGVENPGKPASSGKLWGEDNIEFFLSPGLLQNEIFQFVNSVSGQYEDYFQSFDPPRPLDVNWVSEKVQKAVHADEQGWTLELFIPFDDLDKRPAPLPGDVWLANVVVNRSDFETLALSPTLGNNRNTYCYAKIYFAGNCE